MAYDSRASRRQFGRTSMASCLAASASARVMAMAVTMRSSVVLRSRVAASIELNGLNESGPRTMPASRADLGEVEFGRMFFEIDAGRLADALDLAAPVDLVDVGLEDVVLVEGGFEPHGDGDFEELAVDLARKIAAFFVAFELEDVGDELLGDGGGALAFALGVFGDGAHDADGVDGAMAEKALVLAGENGLAEIFGNLTQRHDRAFFPVDAADFLAEPVVNDRALRHGMDFGQVVTLGARAVNHRQHRQRVETGDERITGGAAEESERLAERPGEQLEQMERPQQQQRTRPRAAGDSGGRRWFAAVLGLRRVAFWHRQADRKRSHRANPSLIPPSVAISGLASRPFHPEARPMTVLDFESPVLDLERELEKLRAKAAAQNIDMSAEIAIMETKLAETRTHIHANLTPWQRVQIARHSNRPFMLDYAAYAFTDFCELHGDRQLGDDSAMPGGFARIGGQRVMLIGHQKGRDTKENLQRNFGCAHPEGYRKAMRLMKLAEKFGLPVITLIDTPGAFPGIGAEERNIAEAIAVNLREMMLLKVPVIAVVLGEGGSGGALGIGVADRVIMLENAYYSVISPEGCAAILWKHRKHAPEAAEAMKLVAPDLMSLGLIDDVIAEPVGGAHHDHQATAAVFREVILRHLAELSAMATAQRLEARYAKFRNFGAWQGKE